MKLDVQGQLSERTLDVDGQGHGGFSKLNNFHGRHICIIPKVLMITSASFINTATLKRMLNSNQ